MDEIKKSVEAIELKFKSILEDLEKMTRGNYAAGQRCRVESVKLEKEFKIFRKVSMVKLPRIRKSRKSKKGQK